MDVVGCLCLMFIAVLACSIQEYSAPHLMFMGFVFDACIDFVFDACIE